MQSSLVRRCQSIGIFPPQRRWPYYAERICWHFYDESEKETESVVLDANGDLRCLNVEKGRWHSLECLESGSVLFECKDGAYAPLGEGEVMSTLGK